MGKSASVPISRGDYKEDPGKCGENSERAIFYGCKPVRRRGFSGGVIICRMAAMMFRIDTSCSPTFFASYDRRINLPFKFQIRMFTFQHEASKLRLEALEP